MLASLGRARKRAPLPHVLFHAAGQPADNPETKLQQHHILAAAVYHFEYVIMSVSLHTHTRTDTHRHVSAAASQYGSVYVYTHARAHTHAEHTHA